MLWSQPPGRGQFAVGCVDLRVGGTPDRLLAGLLSFLELWRPGHGHGHGPIGHVLLRLARMAAMRYRKRFCEVCACTVLMSDNKSRTLQLLAFDE